MRLVAACIALGVLGLVACGDDGTSGSGGSGASASGGAGATGSGGGPPDASCVRPGDKGNEKGVGEYCTPGGDECSGFAEAPLCLASVGQDQWMCTRTGCDETTDCGDGAACLITSDGSACVPCRCEASPGCMGAGGAGGAGGSSSGGAGGA